MMWPSRDRRARTLGLVALSLFLLAGLVPVFGETAAESEARLVNDVKYLASDELEGRGIGTRGLDLAADFIRQGFQRAGLDVTRLDGDAFQTFDMTTGSEIGSPNTFAFTGPDGETIELKHDVDFRAMSFGGAGKFEGEVVFAGYAIDSADDGYQDFKDVDVEGKAVIVLRRTPRQDDPHGPFAGPHGGISRHADLRTKVSNAFGQGAAAILFVNDRHTSRQETEEQRKQIEQAKDAVVQAAEAFDAADPKDEKEYAAAHDKLRAALRRLRTLQERAKTATDDALMKFGYGGHDGRDLPIVHITQEAANKMLKASLGRTLDELEAEIDSDFRPRSALLEGVTLKAETTVNRLRAEVKNVIGVLEGEGPLADETIVVGAHYDHLGRGGPGSGSRSPGSNEIHYGADDNASGAAALIELARRLAAREEKLPRRIVFIAFTAEESGLVGSARYVKEPLFPIEQTVAMFNMDMVGRLRDDKLTVFGTGTSNRWDGMLKDLGERLKFDLTFNPGGFGPSDHSSFYAVKVPVLHLFTGNHDDYHRPTDTWDKVSYEGVRRVVELLEEAVVATATTAERPEYVEVKQRPQAARDGSRPYFGSIPSFGGDTPGYAIQGVAPGSPAAEGGLKGGDVIVEFGGQKIGSLDDFDLALRKFKPGDEAEVVVLRDGEKVPLTVILSKPR